MCNVVCSVWIVCVCVMYGCGVCMCVCNMYGCGSERKGLDKVYSALYYSLHDGLKLLSAKDHSSPGFYSILNSSPIFSIFLHSYMSRYLNDFV